MHYWTKCGAHEEISERIEFNKINKKQSMYTLKLDKCWHKWIDQVKNERFV